MDIVDNILIGDKRAIARAISIIDDEGPQSHELLKQIYQRTGNAVTIGFTGPGGAGKKYSNWKFNPPF